jgi:hypothetical protein
MSVFLRNNFLVLEHNLDELNIQRAGIVMGNVSYLSIIVNNVLALNTENGCYSDIVVRKEHSIRCLSSLS